MVISITQLNMTLYFSAEFKYSTARFTLIVAGFSINLAPGVDNLDHVNLLKFVLTSGAPRLDLSVLCNGRQHLQQKY